MIQLPNDVINCGYVKTKPFQFEQIFFSPSLNFKGTENEFVNAGHGYKYIQLDKHKRMRINKNEK